MSAGNLLPEDLRGRVGDDEVECVIDDRLAGGAAMVVLDGLTQRVPLELGGEGDDRRRAATRRRDGAAAEIVGAPRRQSANADRCGNASRRRRATPDDRSIDLALSLRQPLRDRNDAAASDADIGAVDIRCGGHGAVADNQIVFGQPRLPENSQSDGGGPREQIEPPLVEIAQPGTRRHDLVDIDLGHHDARPPRYPLADEATEAQTRELCL